MLELNKRYVEKNGKEIKILKYDHINTIVVYEFISNGKIHGLPYWDFKQIFKLKEASKTINKDIIKLIESGYEFKSFYGTTLDGKEFHIKMEDEAL